MNVSIVLPCLNEAETLAGCVARAREALRILAERHGLTGEVVVADNGSTDGSQDIARQGGARVVPVERRGYGNALIGGFAAARGHYLVMGDADGSYDFVESVPMVESLLQGNDVCMGSRFRGRVLPGAMPWKNRYIGNPLLTGILNVLFRTGVSDAHCGLRALTKNAFRRLGLTAPGMELASEMVIKASLVDLSVSETPVTLSPDGRSRPPHLRPWRDGWRHLRYLFMLSPWGLFVVPALLVAVVGMGILAGAAVSVMSRSIPSWFGNYWALLGGSLLSLAHLMALFGLTTMLYGARAGYRRLSYLQRRILSLASLETMIVTGLASIAVGMLVLSGLVVSWSTRNFNELGHVLPAVIGIMFVVVGVQHVFGGFVLAIVAGNDADPATAVPVEPGPR